MRGFLGDHFLRRFAGDIKHRWKHLNSPTSEADREDVDAVAGTDGINAAGPDFSVSGANDIPNSAETTKPNESGPTKV